MNTNLLQKFRRVSARGTINLAGFVYQTPQALPGDLLELTAVKNGWQYQVLHAVPQNISASLGHLHSPHRTDCANCIPMRLDSGNTPNTHYALAVAEAEQAPAAKQNSRTPRNASAKQGPAQPPSHAQV
jgi:hypothetical protein